MIFDTALGFEGFVRTAHGPELEADRRTKLLITGKKRHDLYHTQSSDITGSFYIFRPHYAINFFRNDRPSLAKASGE